MGDLGILATAEARQVLAVPARIEATEDAARRNGEVIVRLCGLFCRLLLLQGGLAAAFVTPLYFQLHGLIEG